jgi:protein-tyrosine phosphatase
MAEFVLKDMVQKRGLAGDFFIGSAATSLEEIGSAPHPGTQRKLRAQGVPAGEHRAVRLTMADYDRYDYLLGMDGRNVQNMRRILGGDPQGKVRRLLDFTPRPRDIADPWYTGDFDRTYLDIVEGCEAFLRHCGQEQA